MIWAKNNKCYPSSTHILTISVKRFVFVYRDISVFVNVNHTSIVHADVWPWTSTYTTRGICIVTSRQSEVAFWGADKSRLEIAHRAVSKPVHPLHSVSLLFQLPVVRLGLRIQTETNAGSPHAYGLGCQDLNGRQAERQPENGWWNIRRRMWYLRRYVASGSVNITVSICAEQWCVLTKVERFTPWTLFVAYEIGSLRRPDTDYRYICCRKKNELKTITHTGANAQTENIRRMKHRVYTLEIFTSARRYCDRRFVG